MIWILLLLALVSTILLHETTSERRFAATEVTRLQARLLADAALGRVMLDLLNPQPATHWRLDGTEQSLTLFEQHFLIRISSEAGKIDLNAASPEMLAAVLRFSGLGPAEAIAAADRIIAWRLDAAHRRFRTVSELRLVPSLTDALYATAAPLLTVASRTNTIDRQVASSKVLQVLSDAGDALAATQLEARSQNAPSGADRALAIGEAVTIQAQLTTTSLTLTRTATIHATGDQRQPYWVLDWQ